MALLDLALESTQKDGAAPTMVTTRQLATRVIELYLAADQRVCRERYPARPGQNLPQRDKRDQAEVLRRIQKFREDHAGAHPHRARLEAKEAWEALLTEVEWKLVEMPLPRLQVIGGQPRPFLYQISWGTDIPRRHFKSNAFDNRIILFMPGAAEHMVRLAGLLRPLIQRGVVVAGRPLQWAAQRPAGGLPFGVDRSELTKVRAPLFDLQEAQCFYCARAQGRCDGVDHFIPWARHPNDAIENLVGHTPAAMPPRATTWRHRDTLSAGSSACKHTPTSCDRSGRTPVGIGRPTTFSIARGIYLRLPDQTPLWEASQHFSAASRAELRFACCLAA